METPTYCWSKQSPQRDHPVLGLQSPGAPRNRKLVGGDWNMNFIFPNSWDDDPIWLIFICFRGVGIPTTRKAAESFFHRHYESLCLMIFDPYTHHVSSCFIDEVIMSMTPRGKNVCHSLDHLFHFSLLKSHLSKYQVLCSAYYFSTEMCWISGWCFGTWILWLSIYWECHHPNWLIFFRGVETTNQILNIAIIQVPSAVLKHGSWKTPAIESSMICPCF